MSGLSLRELGRRTGVTASLLSQIENGKSDPSFSTLAALVSALGLSVDALLRADGGGEERSASISTSGPGTDTAVEGARRTLADVSGQRPGGLGSPIVRSAERSTLQMDSGVAWERLIRGDSAVLDAMLVTYQPGATSSVDGAQLCHQGFEYAYLISGELTLQLGTGMHVLKEGDSLDFDATVPHVYRNVGEEPARGLWFVVDPGVAAGGVLGRVLHELMGPQSSKPLRVPDGLRLA